MKGKSTNLVGLLASTLVAVAAPVVGFLFTVLSMRGTFQALDVGDAADRQRRLANGIAGAMYGTLLGLGVSLLAVVPIIVFAVRLARESRRAPP